MDAMLVSEARVATSMAQRYMTQLCKHFEHRLPTSYGAGEGEIAFDSGICRMQAAPELLTLRAEAKDEAALAQLETVVARHLERFAFRDKPQIAWARAAA